MPLAPVKPSRPVILHVDDDVSSLLMAESTLEEAGFTVLHAENGLQAIQQFENQQPDLVIMDAVMPEMDGFEAIQIIRESPKGRHVPILMITGLDDLDSINRAYEEGATDFLTKPVNFHVLPHRVRYLLRSKATADELRDSQDRLDNAQRIARLGNWEWEISSDRFTVSKVTKRLIGIEESQTEIRLANLTHLVHISDRYEMQAICNDAAKKGVAFSVEFRTAPDEQGNGLNLRLEAEPILDDAGNCTHLLGTVQDVTERTNAQKQIHNLAYYDIVTGLPNRAFLNERLNYNLAVAARNNAKFALLFLDLDHFKQVNDTLGHDAGDMLLSEASQRLKEAVRDHDAIAMLASDQSEANDHTVARLGGDEFVVLLSQINREEDAARIAKRIADLIGQPYTINDVEVSVTTTIGISLYPGDGEDAETLMKHADIAMYHAKEQGRNGYQFYSRHIHDQAMARFSLEKELKHAIEEGRLNLLYQPKVDLSSGEVSGVEALVRWQHETMGTISPADFIPLAEETGLIVPLGKWVLNEACRQMQTWISMGLGPFSIAINCSTVQFVRSDMIQLINEAIEISGLDPGWLELELTESLLLKDIDEGIEILNNLKSMGVQVSIDDFGTGFSSLSYLKRLPVDKLKIDQSFVKDLCSDRGDEAIVSAIITLSHKLDLTVVAEGVETLEQVEKLRSFNCNEVQGYLVSYPLAPQEFEQWLRESDSGVDRKAS